jgi:hypothetical protein
MRLEIDSERPNTLRFVQIASPMYIAFVSAAGDDASATPGDWTRPFASLDAACEAVGTRSGCQIHLGPGRFPFFRAHDLPTNALIKGAGRFATVLESRIIGAENRKLWLFTGWDGAGQRLEDLRIDCGGLLPNWPAKAHMAAVDFSGVCASLARVDLVNLIASDSSVESFGLCAQFLDDCRVFDLVPSNGVYSPVLVRRDGVAWRCLVDGSSAPAAYSQAFTPGGNNVKVLACAIRGVNIGVYSDTVPDGNVMRNIVVRDCTFEKLIRNGVALRLRPANEPDDALEDIIFEGNTIYLSTDDMAVQMETTIEGMAHVGKIRRFSIARNHIVSDGDALAAFQIAGAQDGVVGPNSIFGKFKQAPVQLTNCERVRELADLTIDK